jgi:hypothetical protein
MHCWFLAKPVRGRPRAVLGGELGCARTFHTHAILLKLNNLVLNMQWGTLDFESICVVHFLCFVVVSKKY